MTKIQKAKTYECALHVAHNDKKLNIVVKDYCIPLAVVPSEQSCREEPTQAEQPFTLDE